MEIHADQIKWLFGAGDQSFLPVPEWAAQLTRDGIRCSHCKAIRQDAKGKLTTMVLEHIPPGRVFGMILLGGLVLRRDFAELIGLEKLGRWCYPLPIVDAQGINRDDVRFFIERSPRGVWRGSVESRIGLCRECGRLLYSPMGKRYLLRRYWEGAGQATVMENHILCTPDYFNSVVGPQHFPLLKAETRSFADDPQDGLPADYDAMIMEIRRRGWTR